MTTVNTKETHLKMIGEIMDKWVLFTVEHQDYSRIYLRGVGVLSDVSEELEHVLFHHDINTLDRKLPPNPYEKGTEDYNLFNELLNFIKSDKGFEGNVLSCISGTEHYRVICQDFTGYILDMEVIP